MITPAIAHDVGTSFAAPRVAHHLAIIQSDLKKLGIQPSACLMRALLVNCSNHERVEKSFFPAKQKHWFQTVGYGQPVGEQALECDEHNPLLIYDGAVLPDKVALFSIPLPAEMAGDTEKRFRVTVAYDPRVQQHGLQTYLNVSLKFRLFTGDKSAEAIIAAMSLDEGEENVVAKQEEDFPGNLVGIQLRSRGATQHDVFLAKQYPVEWSKHPFTLAVSLTEKWGGLQTSVPLAIAVRIQDKKQAVAKLYSKIQFSLAEARPKARTRA